MLNILSENNDFGFNSFQKITVSRVFPLKCIRTKTWCLTSPMLHTKPDTKSQGHQPLGSGVEDFKGFYHIWAWWPSWSCDQDRLNKLWFPHHMKFEFNWPSGFKCLKMLKDGRKDIQQSHWYTYSSPMSLRLR